jgi:hypothetical protein
MIPKLRASDARWEEYFSAFHDISNTTLKVHDIVLYRDVIAKATENREFI